MTIDERLSRRLKSALTMGKIDKLIVSHRAALRRKHGPRGLEAIEAQVARLVRADKRRGLSTRLVYLDVAALLPDSTEPVRRASDRRGTKDAIDALCQAHGPDYLMLLGAPDVVPHQRLENLLARDDDRLIASDLPYACEAPFSATISDFLGPTRVVGRLPDVQGSGDTPYLVGLLRLATRFSSRSRASYRHFFALSTDTWKDSTRTSIGKLFGSQRGVQLSPGADRVWTRGELAGRVHFINCHGDTRQPRFFGEDAEGEQPIAIESRDLVGKVSAATVVAAEWCYGAQLYQPSTKVQRGICSVYLSEGAVGFFGSTCVAWGPEEGTNFADYLCIKFVKALQQGASLGSAALQARQYYIGLDGYMEMVDLKTLAQFILLGDPSIRPMRARAATRTETPQRHLRRVRSASKGRQVAKTTAHVDQPRARRGSPALRAYLAENEIRARHIDSYPLLHPERPVLAKLGRNLIRRGTVFHVVVARKKPGSRVGGRSELIIAREVAGKIDRVVHAKRRT